MALWLSDNNACPKCQCTVLLTGGAAGRWSYLVIMSKNDVNVEVVVSGGVVSGVIHIAGDDEYWDWTSVHQSVYRPTSY